MGLERARTSGQVSVTTGSTQIVPYRAGRRQLILTNDGANVIYVMLSTASPVDGAGSTVYPTATANNGVRLNANGGSLVLDDYDGPVSAIALTATTVLNVLEL